MAPDCKSGTLGYVGSNPTLFTKIDAPLDSIYNILLLKARLAEGGLFAAEKV